jgi:GTP-binding protein Era
MLAGPVSADPDADSPPSPSGPRRAGTVALLGRPNAGKSTLLNRVIGQKLAIVSDKPQTTRTRIVGVKNYPGGQLVFVDTPGLHKPTHRMNARMVDLARDTIQEVDVVGLLVDAAVRTGAGDQYVLEMLRPAGRPVLLILNKVDRIEKTELLPLIDWYRQAYPFAEFVPISARDGTNVEQLEELFLRYVPEGDPLYPEEHLTDQTERFLAAELVREQVLRMTRDELPFSTTVVVEQFNEPGDGGILKLYCSILVERDSQKRIVVGHGGSMIKQIGTAARLELERHFESRVFLDLHVKVKSEWRNDDRLLDEIQRQNRS